MLTGEKVCGRAGPGSNDAEHCHSTGSRAGGRCRVITGLLWASSCVEGGDTAALAIL